MYNPEIHHRRSIRLQGFDYSRNGTYFITIVTHDRVELFGEIAHDEMRLNDAGKMIEYWWHNIFQHFPNAKFDAFIVMPNHIHGIIIIQNNENYVGANRCVCPDPDTNADMGARAGAPLPRMVQWFKTMTTNEYIRHVKNGEWSSFPGKLWQRNYYERIVRNDDELYRVRAYIFDNPGRWENGDRNFYVVV